MAGSRTPISTADYVIFVIFLVISFVIGSLAALRHKSSATSFVLGDRQFGAVPVALSIFSSFWSATAILGYPSELYQYGSQFWLMCIGNVLSSTLTAFVFVPKIRSLEIVSLYQYLELRFNKPTKLAASLCFVIQNVLYLSVVIYSPSLAMEKVLGLNMWVSMVVVTSVCIVYSAIGGVRGVIWTDVFQFIIISVGLITILALGVSNVGGWPTVIRDNRMGGRIEFFVFDPDPRTRHTFFSIIIGTFGMSLGVYSFNQINVQRYMGIKTDKLAKVAIFINLLGLCVSLTLCLFIGMVIYSHYKDCDPILNGTIDSPNLVLPLFITETIGSLPGLTGLFLATICSGTMSTVSSNLNSLAAVIVYDFVKPSLRTSNFNHWLILLRITTVLLGLISFSMIFLIRKIGFVIQAAISILGLYGGPITGLFFVGFFIPFVRSKSAFSGFLISLAFQTWLLIGSIMFASEIRTPTKPMSTNACSPIQPSLYPLSASQPTDLEGVIGFYAISYMWHSVTGILSCLVLCLAISLLLGDLKATERVDERLLIIPSCWAKYSSRDPSTVSLKLMSAASEADLVDDQEKRDSIDQ